MIASDGVSKDSCGNTLKEPESPIFSVEVFDERGDKVPIRDLPRPIGLTIYAHLDRSELV